MKIYLVSGLFLFSCFFSACAVAPTKTTNNVNSARSDKRAELIRNRTENQVGQAAVDSRERKIGSVRDRRGTIQRPVADDINPAQTSDDPSFGYTRENPVRLGSASGEISQHVTSSYVYLKQLRDEARLPFKYIRIGSVGAGEDGHIMDAYKLTDSKGTDFKIFIDMYHPDSNPLDCQAPKGMFIAQ